MELNASPDWIDADPARDLDRAGLFRVPLSRTRAVY